MPALADQTHANGERQAPPQNRRVTIHDNDQENMLVEAVTLKAGSPERVLITEYFAPGLFRKPEVHFTLSLEEAAALYADLGKFLDRRGMSDAFKARAAA